MKPETKFLLIRISIYLIGFLIIVWIVFLNISKVKNFKVPLLKNSETNYGAYINRAFDQATIHAVFKNTAPNNIQISTKKDFSIFQKEMKRGIYSLDELKNKLHDDNTSQIANGNFVKYQNAFYYVEEGSLRKISQSIINKIFLINDKMIPEIDSETFSKFYLSKEITENSLQEDFIKNLIIRVDDVFYLSRSNSYQPLYIENLDEFFKESNQIYIELHKDSENGTCLKTIQGNEIFCTFKIKKNPANYYDFKIINGSEIYEVELELIDKMDIKEILNQIKLMFSRK